MSRTRRRTAQRFRWVVIGARRSKREGQRYLSARHPVEFFRARHDPVDSAPYVVLPGWTRETRTRSGRLVFSERGPDYFVPLPEWARAVWTRPRPLPRSLRGKLRGRR